MEFQISMSIRAMYMHFMVCLKKSRVFRNFHLRASVRYSFLLEKATGGKKARGKYNKARTRKTFPM